MDLEQLQDDVFDKLNMLDVTQLGECCVQLNQVVPPNKKGKKSGTRGLLFTYLTSPVVADSEDEGRAIFEDLDAALDRMLKNPDVKSEQGEKPAVVAVTASGDAANAKDTKISPEATGGGGSGAGVDGGSSGSTVTTRIDLTRIKEFKISNGTIGKEESMTLDNYKSLCYQVEEGKALGYRSREIVAGVIKGMNQPLKGYFEGKPGWTEDTLMKTMRTFCHVKDSTELLEQMSTSFQEPTENEMSFLVRMMGLRDTIITLTKLEPHSLSEELVRRKFLRFVAAGLRKDTVRLQFQLQFQNYYEGIDRDDHELMDKLRLVVDLDDENTKKVKGKKDLRVHSIEALNGELERIENEKERERKRAEWESTDNAILAEIKQMRAEVKAEVKQMRGEFNNLKKKVDSGEKNHVGFRDVPEPAGDEGNVDENTERNTERNRDVGTGDRRGAGGRPFRRFPYVKCQSCEEKHSFCTHCSVCGSGGHKRKDCPKNL